MLVAESPMDDEAEGLVSIKSDGGGGDSSYVHKER